ncbi:alcohol dehydrogenase [Providencia rustigianii]
MSKKALYQCLFLFYSLNAYSNQIRGTQAAVSKPITRLKINHARRLRKNEPIKEPNPIQIKPAVKFTITKAMLITIIDCENSSPGKLKLPTAPNPIIQAFGFKNCNNPPETN